MTQNGVILTATGDLLRMAAKPYDFSADGAFDSGTETIRTDVPIPAYNQNFHNTDTKHHRWNGSAWVLITSTTEYNHRSSQSGAPTTTPGRIGFTNIDTSNGTVYVSTGTASSSDWTAV